MGHDEPHANKHRDADPINMAVHSCLPSPSPEIQHLRRRTPGKYAIERVGLMPVDR